MVKTSNTTQHSGGLEVGFDDLFNFLQSHYLIMLSGSVNTYILFTAPIASLINFSSALSLATYHSYVISNVHFANISQTL